jgi:DNA-binding MarR family transcriptional regulator
MSIARKAEISRLNSAVTHLIRRIRRIDESQDIGRARLSALAVLHFGGSSTLTELAATELVTLPTMHHIVNGLENDGLVRRMPDAEDGRRQRVELTREGRAAIVKAHRARLEFLEGLAIDVTLADLATTVRCLEALDVRAGDD